DPERFSDDADQLTSVTDVGTSFRLRSFGRVKKTTFPSTLHETALPTRFTQIRPAWIAFTIWRERSAGHRSPSAPKPWPERVLRGGRGNMQPLIAAINTYSFLPSLPFSNFL